MVHIHYTETIGAATIGAATIGAEGKKGLSVPGLFKPTRILFLIFLTVLACLAPAAESKKKHAWVPFVYNSKTMGFGLGAAGITHGLIQPQASIFATGMYTTNNSWLVYSATDNYQLYNFSRIFLGGSLFFDRLTNPALYIPNEQSASGTEIGSNNSSEENYVTGLTNNETIKVYLKYFFPFAAGKGHVGKLLDKKESHKISPQDQACCDPLLSLKATMFYQTQTVLADATANISSNIDEAASGLELALSLDSRNNNTLPSQGAVTRISLAKDWGMSGSVPWRTWSFNQSYFLGLPQNSHVLQQVLALNFFIAGTPSWDDYSGSANSPRYHRPPPISGNTLGGFDRMRGYAYQRYFGRSAINYVAEYRVLPDWQPLKHWPVFKYFDIPWWQWVGFAEWGRVADSESWSSLNKDLQWDAGLGISISIENVLLRTSYAVGNEGGQFWVMIGQPF